jgi:hypothetical protein
MNIIEGFQDMLDFWGFKPIEVESNAGGLWFRDENTKKHYFVMIDECSPLESE